MGTGRKFAVCVTISKKGDLFLKVKVQPNSSKSGISGIFDGALKVSLNSPPVEGKANDELIKYLSKFLHIPKRNIEIVQGERGRIKTVKIEGISEEILREKIGAK